MYKEMLRILGVAALVGSSGCLPTYEPGKSAPPKDPSEEQGPEKAPETSTEPVAVRPQNPAEDSVSWLNAGDAAVLAERAKDEGPIDVASRHHACMKVKYETVGRLLQSLGVSFTPAVLPVTAATNCRAIGMTVGNISTQSQPARFVYCDSRLTLGFPQYEARLAEATAATTASSTKLLDLFVSAAAEIIANAPTSAQCRDASNQPSPIFNADNTCNKKGLTCIQGYPATDDQVALCNRVVTQAVASGGTSAIDNGKRIAVATVLSAAHSCE